jgi:S-disulfanyl-L-cysteine oxidoreductase SoxD
MYMHRLSSVAAVLSVILTAPCLGQGPELGQVTSEAEIAAWDISISPDGAGLPPGGGTAKQGEVIYAAQCASCHGEKGAGNPNEPVSDVSAGPLVGGLGTLAGNRGVSYWPYATIVFDYVRRAMPWGAPKSLTDQEVYSLTAYLLYLNGIISEADVINVQTLPKVQMPNRDNFIRIYPREPSARLGALAPWRFSGGVAAPVAVPPISATGHEGDLSLHGSVACSPAR